MESLPVIAVTFGSAITNVLAAPIVGIGLNLGTGVNLDVGSGDRTLSINCDLFNKALDAVDELALFPKTNRTRDPCDNFIGRAKNVDGMTNTEAATLLTHSLWETGGFNNLEEKKCQTQPCLQYNNKGDSDFHPVPGKNYFGRGYIQLTYPYNYGGCSQKLFNDNRLLENPDIVSSDINVAWDSAFWYWSENIVKKPEYKKGHFGTSTNVVNGGLECRGDPEGTDKAKKRFKVYTKILAVFSPDEEPIEDGCYDE
ncbi:hypothetical protein H4219_002231 [Mycoemilia scoparia]|uniref:Glycoside hydrolase family 19 catalytic domain-containing protein n=1 Tax=Mycoemilia scoparia TaxID=417184 RepID=A0A9W8A1R4_9FUNG|nr:hypothetical protein H4219_002231 [Mycoemilia scoparia]